MAAKQTSFDRFYRTLRTIHAVHLAVLTDYRSMTVVCLNG